MLEAPALDGSIQAVVAAVVTALGLIASKWLHGRATADSAKLKRTLDESKAHADWPKLRAEVDVLLEAHAEELAEADAAEEQARIDAAVAAALANERAKAAPVDDPPSSSGARRRSTLPHQMGSK